MRSEARWVLALAAVMILEGCQGRFERKSEAPAVSEPEASEVVAGDETGAAPMTEAARSQAMQNMAVEMNQGLEQAQAGDPTQQESEQAYQEFERQRLEMNRLAEGRADSATASDAADYPPPP